MYLNVFKPWDNLGVGGGGGGGWQSNTEYYAVAANVQIMNVGPSEH